MGGALRLAINSAIAAKSLNVGPMQRLRLTSNVHFGLALGITTASVILALSGCVTTSGSMSTERTRVVPARAGSAASISLEQFSEEQRTRILSVQSFVAEAAAEHDVDPALINGMIWVESRFNPKAKSPAGARGLMQLMPATAAYLAKRLGEHNARVYDPEFNVRAGSLYLAEMLAKFGDEHHAIAAYHAGPGNVKKWVDAGRSFPDYSKAYVAKVMQARARFTGVHGRSSRTRTAAVAPAARPGLRFKPAPDARRDQLEEIREPGEPEGLIVPDVATLPDAAEIHGIERDTHERGKFEFEPKPIPEPVFERHPELDRDRGVASPGWNTSRARAWPHARPKPRPARRPEPRPEREPPEREPPEQEIGLGVLPDL